MTSSRFHFALLVAVIPLLISAPMGCSIGPIVLKGNRIDYNVSIQKSNNEDLLVNMVRASYCEPLFFLQVGTISSSFNYGATVGATGTLNERTAAGLPNSLGASLGSSFSEVPTITYAPIQGKEAVSRLLTEIPIDRLWLLTRSLVTITSLMWVMVEKIGPLHNYNLAWKRDNPLLKSYDRFLELSQMLGDMQARGDLDFLETEKDARGQLTITAMIKFLDLREAEKFENLLDIRLQKTVLPDGKSMARIHLSENCEQGPANCIPVKMKSFFAIIYDLSQTYREDSVTPDVPWRQEVPEYLMKRKGSHRALIVIHASASAPRNAYVAVRYRGQWHYISDEDIQSKAYFTLLETIFSLQAAEVPLVQPILTLPSAR
jgi:hypothetical protein